MSDCGCLDPQKTFDGMSVQYKRILWVVIAINAAMFFVEMAAGQLAGSQALQADALDFMGDAMTYGISLAAIGASVAVRTNAALFKAFTLFAMGLWVAGSTVWRVFYIGVPQADIMGMIGFLALRLLTARQRMKNVIATCTIWPTTTMCWPMLQM
jgi:Co/Zn/Cd efflux system component